MVRPIKDVRVNEKQYRFLQDNENKRITILYGGAGSGKSWSIAQYLLFEKFVGEKDIGILVVRKTLPSLKSSAYKLLIHELQQYGIKFEHNKSDMCLRRGNNFILFRGLDDIEKVKSIEGINYVWMEEATECSKADLMQLNLRARAYNCNGTNNRLFLSFNPIDVRSFLKPMTEKPPSDCAVQLTTYRDNAFLDKFYIEQLEKLIEHDKTYHLIYNMGQWAAPGNIVYTNWKSVNVWPRKFQEIVYGLDFGYNAPTALIELGITESAVYCRELLYERKLTNSQLIRRMKNLILSENRSRNITADCAEPDRIEEIYQAGFNVHECFKGKGSVKVGIDRVKRLDIRVLSSSENIITEFQSYKWKVDRYENVLDEVDPHADHAMDAIRYALGSGQEIKAQLFEIGNYDFESFLDNYGELGAVA